MINKEQIFLGSLLGDGSIFKQNNNLYAHYYECHSLKQKEYLSWKNRYMPFETNLREYKDRIVLTSNNNPLLNVYNNYRKDNNLQRLIIERLNPLGFFIWYLDDGSYNYAGAYMVLSTIGYDKDILKLVQSKLLNLFGVTAKLRYVKNDRGFILIISSKDTQILLNELQYYIAQIPKNMLYKFGKDKIRLTQRQVRQRKYREKHKEKLKKYRKEYWINNKEKLTKQHNEWVERNREKLKGYRIEKYNSTKFKRKDDYDRLIKSAKNE